MKKYFKYLFAIVLIAAANSTFAQINPFDALYFQNAYLANSAMTGFEDNARINLGYRNQWSSVPGAPRMQYIAYDVKQNKVGWGLTVLNNKEGGITENKFVGSFAIHLPLNNPKNQIHLGLNLSALKLQYNLASLEGNPNDPALQRYNDRGMIYDGDFGVAYTSERLNLEFAYYNLSQQVFKEQNRNLDALADYNRYFAALTYRIPMQNWTMGTKLAYRSVKNYTNLVDFGLELRTKNEKLAFSGIYHSNKSTSFGLSYLHHKKWEFVGFYNTSQNPIRSVANGSFEIGLKTTLVRSKK